MEYDGNDKITTQLVTVVSLILNTRAVPRGTPLKKRHFETLAALIVNGNQKRAADTLRIGERTVRNHLEEILDCTGLALAGLEKSDLRGWVYAQLDPAILAGCGQ